MARITIEAPTMSPREALEAFSDLVSRLRLDRKGQVRLLTAELILQTLIDRSEQPSKSATGESVKGAA